MKKITLLTLGLAMLAGAAFAGVGVETKFQYNTESTVQDDVTSGQAAYGKMERLRLKLDGETKDAVKYDIRYKTSNINSQYLLELDRMILTKKIMGMLDVKIGYFEPAFAEFENDDYYKSAVGYEASKTAPGLGFGYAMAEGMLFRVDIMDQSPSANTAGTRGAFSYNIAFDGEFAKMFTLMASYNTTNNAGDADQTNMLVGVGVKFGDHKLTAGYAAKTLAEQADRDDDIATTDPVDRKQTSIVAQLDLSFGKLKPSIKFNMDSDADGSDDRFSGLEYDIAMKFYPKEDCKFNYYAAYVSETLTDEYAVDGAEKDKDSAKTTMIVGVQYDFSFL